MFTLDSQQTVIVSGGVDGMLSVWNQFSGGLKHAIKLPDAKHDPYGNLMSGRTDDVNKIEK